MKILHVNNISGVASTLSEELKHHGLQSDVLVFETSKYGFPNDHLVTGSSMVKILRAMFGARKYDLVHWHFPRQRRSIALFNHFKPVLKHYHGSDLRGKREEEFCLAAMPELLYYAPKAVYFPHPVKVEEIAPSYKTTNDVPIVCWYRSTVTQVEMIQEAQSNLNDHCLFKELIGYTHEEALQVIANCDIFLDVRVNGWYGLSSAEAMACGKPVIGYIREDYDRKYTPPVVSHNAYGSLTDTLNKVLDDAKFREQLGRSSREYALANHDVVKAVETLLPIYQELAGSNS